MVNKTKDGTKEDKQGLMQGRKNDWTEEKLIGLHSVAEYLFRKSYRNGDQGQNSSTVQGETCCMAGV
jgi:hypothetical protein